MRTPGTDSNDQRKTMVEQQLRAQKPAIQDARVLQAMLDVPRHEFVPLELQSDAYANRPLDIGCAQTISQPYVVAFMTEKLKLEPHHRVLEIGTGSGYQAAVLSKLVQTVYTMEIIAALALRAEEAIARLELDNVLVKVGDGYQGWLEQAPFDAIIVTCAPDHLPQPLVEQLREGGRLVVPVGEQGRTQLLHLLEKRDGKVSQEAVLPVRFVPMTGEALAG